MHRVVEREVLEFIIPGGTKGWILLCGSRQDSLEFLVMYNTGMLGVNCMKDFRREGIKLCAVFW